MRAQPTPTPEPVPEDQLEDVILLDTDRGIIGQPARDGTFRHANVGQRNGRPAKDAYYSVMHVGENRAMGFVPKDKSWSNLNAGFIVDNNI